MFSGLENQTLSNCGSLLMHVGEWQLFGTMMHAGLRSLPALSQHLVFTVEGEYEALNPINAKEEVCE